MKKTIILIISIIILLIIAISYTWIHQNRTDISPTEVNPIDTFPESPLVEDIPTGESVTLLGNSQQEIIASNFYEAATPDTDNPGLYFVGNTFDTESPSYVVSYESDSSLFIIALLEEPIRDSRLEVEDYLEDILGLDKNIMCSLRYTLSVPGYVNRQYSGVNLGFSFCPNSVPL